ncbi:hypothetical protein [Pseudoalteromonas ardens]|uniref:hypothetical protein n=1 Tax=Pseudoalteromonas ardens TaxID=3048490 RepID=UPI0024C2EF02|nr:hypothetical protein [Pseudoalteromonas sp. R96]MDK1311684.1 hypothetical protein [Pseudoalteromonas sp. R96]
MKTLTLSFAAVALFSAFGSQATAYQNVFDTDGYERLTNYTSGPVSSALLTGEFAHNFEAQLVLRGEGAYCESANLYSANDGRHIVNLGVKTIADRNTVEMGVAIPEATLTEKKVLHVSCYDAAGDWYKVLVNVPGAPVVDWQIELTPAGDFVNQPYSYGYHTAYHISSRLVIDNQNNDARCSIVADRGVSLGLFHGEDRKGPFHSDVFTLDTVVDNKAKNPVLYQILECENAVGKTMAVKVFNLTDPNGIYTYEDQLIVK